jgi:hypothetical protein
MALYPRLAPGSTIFRPHCGLVVSVICEYMYAKNALDSGDFENLSL